MLCGVATTGSWLVQKPNADTKVYSIPPIDLAFFWFHSVLQNRANKMYWSSGCVTSLLSQEFTETVSNSFTPVFSRLAKWPAQDLASIFQTQDSSAAAWTVHVRESVRLRF
jgi:hypothetical protein